MLALREHIINFKIEQMINWIKKLFNGRKQHCNIPDVIHSITCGERDENGFADTYVNGKKTNVRLLHWNNEDLERLQKIGEEIHNRNNSK
jgi:hypothetical protein